MSNLYLKIIHPVADSDKCRVTLTPSPGGAVWGHKASNEQGSAGEGDLVVDVLAEDGSHAGQVLVGLNDEAYLINDHGDTVQRVGFVYKPGRFTSPLDQLPKQPPKNDPGVA